MARDDLIKSWGDANFELGLSEDFSVVFPIDEAITEFCEKGIIQMPIDQAKLEARRATLWALSSATRALSTRQRHQIEKHSVQFCLSASVTKQ